MHKSSDFPPPPPRRRRRTAGGATDLKSSQNEEKKSEIAARNKCVSANRTSTRTYYFRKSKRMRMLLTNMESLPDEMVFAILVKLPAQFIYDIARLVCWKWYRMIRTPHFIHEHLQHSSTSGSGSGLILQEMSKRLKFLSIQQEDRTIVISNFTYEFLKQVWNSCNGLVLVSDHVSDPYAIYISNLTTNQQFVLPRFFGRTSPSTKMSGLAYVESSMEYKVVISYRKVGEDNRSDDISLTCCAILTVGVDDSWRDISTDHLSANARRLLCSTPLVTQGGFMHWWVNYYNYDMNRVVTLNVETETFRETLVPRGYEEREKRYLSIGSYICFVVGCGELSWEVWEMKSETGEWTKLMNIDLKAEKWRIEELLLDEPDHHRGYSLRPVGWLIYKEVIVFYVVYCYYLCIVYDVRTDKIQHFSFQPRGDSFVIHTKSLVWMDA